MAVPRITVHGRVADLQTHEFANGGLMVRLRIVANDRRKNPETGAWEDADTYWSTVKVLSDKLARHVAASIRKSDLVVVTGRLRTVKWTDDSGRERNVDEVIADVVGPSLEFRELKHGEPIPEPASEPAEPAWPQTSWDAYDKMAGGV
jgi:single-strand DNA-binding protein